MDMDHVRRSQQESASTKAYWKRVKTTEQMGKVKSLVLNNKINEALANELEIGIITQVK